MKIETNIDVILGMLDRPAFCVAAHTIQAANQAALNQQVPLGEPLEPLLLTGLEEYRNLASGSLHLTLTIGGQPRSACVTRLNEVDLFTLEPDTVQAELRSFMLAAQELRIPLGQILTVSDRLFPELDQSADPGISTQLAQINRGLYQMLRIVGNMSDAGSAGTTRMEIRDVAGLVDEVMDHICVPCQEKGISLQYTGYSGTLFSLVDAQKLERAIYNLLSNAIKHTVSGGTITVSLTLRNKSICLMVADSGHHTPVSVSQQMFTHFHREPGIGSLHPGLGLGMTLVRTVAAAHGGTLLLDESQNGGLRATLSFPICQKTDQLCFRSLRIDYAGERDHALVELADLLSPEHYAPGKI